MLHDSDLKIFVSDLFLKFSDLCLKFSDFIRLISTTFCIFRQLSIFFPELHVTTQNQTIGIVGR